MSQLDLAFEAEVSSKHLSFLETGRALPSREMILRLAETLEVPLRERNLLMTAAGYAPVFAERSLDDPKLDVARQAMDLVLAGQEPFPALAIDRHWTLLAANRAVAPLLASAEAWLLEPPVNVLRLSLHPQGIAPRILNFVHWRSHLMARLQHQIQVTGDSVLSQLCKELCEYPSPRNAKTNSAISGEEYGGIIVPLQMATDFGSLSLYSTTTVFGTPLDVTLSEIAIEAFYPADDESANLLRGFFQKA